MSYTALYRKYRPSRFEDVLGQDAVVTTLKNQVKASRIGHAYLFCGTRGTGKTTAAKIFARAVNCEDPRDGSPCGRCRACLEAASGASMNIIEMDAASNNGVDNIRQINEEVSYPPASGKYKVYIIDEAHMITQQAFNALLKTLEEPPSYVIFILATTEVNKIPLTILSRCQRYDFRRIQTDVIIKNMTGLLEKENVQADEDALRFIARAGDGSMRDSLSLLDQCISFYVGERLTLDHVLDILGSSCTDVYDRLIRAVLADDAAEAIRVLDEAVMNGREIGRFVNDFVWHLRNVLLIKSSPDMESMLDLSSEDVAVLKEEADMIKDEELVHYIRVFAELSESLRLSEQKRVLTEIAIIKLCRPQMEIKTDALLSRIARLERKAEEGALSGAGRERETKAQETKITKKNAPRVMPPAIPEDIKDVVKNRDKITGSFDQPMRHYLKEAAFSAGEDGDLIIAFEDQNACELAGRRLEDIKEKISEAAGKDIRVRIVQNETAPSGESLYPDLGEFIDFELTEEDFQTQEEP